VQYFSDIFALCLPYANVALDRVFVMVIGLKAHNRFE